jgi:hypothetical protein
MIQITQDETGHGIPRFIEANTETIDILSLENDYIIPVFTKDNERVISHPEFINAAHDAVITNLGTGAILNTAVSVSHMVKGRIPSAMHKPAKELQEHETTKYFERMAFMMRLDEETSVAGDAMGLCLAGVRAYNLENLSGRKKMELFKVAIGYNIFACSNLALSAQGVRLDLQAASIHDLQIGIANLIREYKGTADLDWMNTLTDIFISESQFAQILGKCRLYQHHPRQKDMPRLLLTDTQVSTIAKGYYADKDFAGNGNISLWKMYNLFTGSVKSSYIDSYLDKALNARQFIEGIANVVTEKDDEFAWYFN